MRTGLIRNSGAVLFEEKLVTGISVEWEMTEPIWGAAGRAFQSYAARRRKHTASAPRRMLADFLIGAHALRNGHALSALDAGRYKTAFPRLPIVSI